MMKKRLSKKIWYGSDVDTEGNPVLPPLAIDSDDLEGLHYGELYLHIADDKLSLWTRTLTDQVKQIGGSGSGDGELWQLRQTDTGEPYLFSPFDVAVQRGLTSYVDGGDLDLPSIYDGLPIDGDTLYWVLDENGKKVMLKSKGGNDEGGGVADSVHWNNIEGKPDFSQYATKDSLSGYLPLSGGTMTGQINMPVGIGKAIKFGAESRLFAYNGNFYISAEANLVLASGASGNTVPNNAVIDKTGRMFIANNLVVGRSSFITDSYKLNVAGDAYVNGKLVVSGTIYPSISSLHNIGDPSKRFACVYADSVDVGGVKISLLQDGVLLIDGNLAVTGGITSYVDGGDLDLPSIYDGLPIDGDTLYWVLDDNGNKVMLKSKGGGSGGGVADSVHWNDIEGKPNFDDYATQDDLKDYLPLSGGTMTGKITLPVGIGTPSLDWGENGSLGGIWVSSTGIFQIIAESEFRVLTNVDGVSTRQFGISNAGNMGVTGTLLVGKDGYLTNSQFKFYVYDGDAFIDGMLAVDGNVNPNIPSTYNIGDSSKRFACVYADSVDVGGVKIRLLQDGVLLIDGNLAVTGGITSYVDGGDLDLPSIYDGLPIDGDTLYWVLDENGKKVMLKSKGGDEEGGGSVKFPLTWSGFSEGSWNGSEAKAIVIPSKLSELDSNDDLTLGGSLNMPSSLAKIKCGDNSVLECYNNGGDTYVIGENYLYLATQNLFTLKEGKVYGILHEGNYMNYEYTAKNLSVVDIRDTTPKPSDIETFAVTAQFANTDNPGDGWYSGLSIQGWTNDYKAWQLRSGAWGFASDHLYFRNGELETWNDWRRVITGDVDGVIDYDLKVHGNIVVDTDNLSAIDVSHRSSSRWNFALTSFNPMMPDDSLEIIEFGKGPSAYNAGSIGFRYFGDSSPNNMVTISLYNSDEILNITGHRRVGINTTTPRHELEVNGQIGVTYGIKLYGAEGDDIESVVNPNGCIENGIYELTSIRHALRFRWHDDAYEIGTIRGASSNSVGFGVTYQNNQLVWKVNKEQMDVFGALNLPYGHTQIKCGENALLVSYNGSTDTYLSGNEHLYLMSKNIFAFEGSEEIYRILHEGNYRNYDYTAKWLSVVDIRNTTPKPSDLGECAITAQFANTDNPGDGWYSGLSIQGWTNDYKAWQLRSGAWGSASDHLYFRNGELDTWNDWRRVITGDVNGVLDSNLEIKGEEGGNIKFVINPDRSIGNGMYELASIRHALRFPWYDDAYEIGTVRSNSADAWGFGVTYQNNQLVWRVDRERMDVYGDLIVKGIVDSVTITSLQEQLNGLWKRNWFEDLSATMIMADNASFERLYGDSIIIGDCKLSYDYEKKTLVIQKFDGTDTNVVISGGLTTYSTNV